MLPTPSSKTRRVDEAPAEPDDYDLAVAEVSGEEVHIGRRRRCRRGRGSGEA